MAVAALRTTNPILLIGLGTVVIAVGVICRSKAPWGRSVGVFVKIGLFVIVLRVLLQVVFGQRLPGHVLFTLPAIPMPAWAEGVSIGGPVTIEGILVALVGGLRLGVVLVCFGVANAIASPREVLRSLPAVLHEVAVAVTVGLCFVPEVMGSVARVREARLLRGRPTKGFAGFRGIAIPVLEDALDRSTQLAASMGARGFGRAGTTPTRSMRFLSRTATIIGALLMLLGGYGTLTASGAIPGAPLLLVCGVVALGVGVASNTRRSTRTRYRPTPFGLRSALCVVAGWVPAACMLASAHLDPASMSWSPYPLTWPSVPVLATVGVLLGVAPIAFIEPARRREGVEIAVRPTRAEAAA